MKEILLIFLGVIIGSVSTYIITYKISIKRYNNPQKTEDIMKKITILTAYGFQYSEEMEMYVLITHSNKYAITKQEIYLLSKRQLKSRIKNIIKFEQRHQA